MDDQTTPPAFAGVRLDAGAVAPATAPHGTAQAKPAISAYRFVSEVAKTLLLAFVIYLGVRTVVLPYRVDGASMSPNLGDHDRLLVNRQAYVHYDANALWNVLPWEERDGENIVYPFGAPERGDIIVFNPPNGSDKPYVKRVIGLPGETVSFHDGSVYVDGERLAEEYIDGVPTECAGPRFRYCEATVPEGHVYVLGDNRLPHGSEDSRAFGVVSVDDIIGEAVFTNWPLDAIGPVSDPDYDE